MKPRIWIVVALLPTTAVAQSLMCRPANQNGIYDVGETAAWTCVRLDAAAPPLYTYTVKKNNMDVLKTGDLDLTAGSAKIEAQLNEPGMIYVQIKPEGDAASKPAATLGAAVAPASIQPAVPRPADFDAFWQSKLEALRKVPINPVLTPVDTEVAGVELNRVMLDSVGSHVQGYLAKPQRPGKFPALVIYQWAGVYALQTGWATGPASQGWLVFDVDSHDMAPAEATAPKDYQAVGNTDRETSYFLNMYLRDTRAIDYITTRPDWDGKTIVVTGTSMGGQQSLVTAGLNPDRITALVVNVPSGADSNGNLHGRQAGYPNWPSDDPKVMQTAVYFDTVNFAPKIRAASMVAMGFIDTISPPAGIWAAFNQIPGFKEAIPMVESDHNNITPDKQGAWNTRSKEVLDLVLNGGVYKAQPSKWKQALDTDPADLKRYRDANAKTAPPAPGENRVVFMGDSITDAWARYFPASFPDKPYIGRGISAETTQQMLIRFRPDVIALKPKAVVILAGTNDIAGNTSRSTQEMIQDNLISMVDLAETNKIKVVLVSVLPAYEYWWQPGMEPAEKIVALNRWIKDFAAKRGLMYVDCHTPLSDEWHGLRKEYSPDGVHPNAAGYAVMAPLVEAGIEEALRR